MGLQRLLIGFIKLALIIFKMIISRTPFRISFFGGGTDYPDWYKKHGGTVLSTTFDKYCYITCRELPPFFEHNYRVAYSIVENVKTVEEIKHPAVRAALREINFNFGLEIHADADLPARSGLGSSSSFVVGLINCLHALNGKRISQASLASEAIRLEQDVMGESVGSQDQTAAAYGGFNVIKFGIDKSIKVEPVILSPGRLALLNCHLMLFFTGFSRNATEIAKYKIANLDSNSSQLNQMQGMVDSALNILSENKDIRGFGELLHDAWRNKQTLSDKVSTPEIDKIYEVARKSGAIGGKLLGAGGGGFMLFFVDPKKQADVKTSLSNYVHVPFQFENTGSQIIHYQH
jgi:D-glycero-alpha-D-manno-heptose-7-phosphate kinase